MSVRTIVEGGVGSANNDAFSDVGWPFERTVFCSKLVGENRSEGRGLDGATIDLAVQTGIHAKRFGSLSPWHFADRNRCHFSQFAGEMFGGEGLG